MVAGWMVLSLWGCAGSEYPPDLPLDEVYTACASPAECVVVELGCCDACNGGTAVAVRADQADAVEEAFSERCGGDVMCTDLGCAPWVVGCDAGTCTRERGSFE